MAKKNSRKAITAYIPTDTEEGKFCLNILDLFPRQKSEFIMECIQFYVQHNPDVFDSLQNERKNQFSKEIGEELLNTLLNNVFFQQRVLDFHSDAKTGEITSDFIANPLQKAIQIVVQEELKGLNIDELEQNEKIEATSKEQKNEDTNVDTTENEVYFDESDETLANFMENF